MSILIDIIISCITLIIFTFLNSQGLIDGPSPSINNFGVSVLFLLLWFGYGLIRGRKKNKAFFFFSFIFWIIGFLIILICIWLHTTPFLIIALFYIGPMNGMNYFNVVSSSLLFSSVVCTIVPLIITTIGYKVGSTMKKEKVEYLDK